MDKTENITINDFQENMDENNSPQVQDEEPQDKVYRVYKYNRNGKEITVKRTWKKRNVNANKRQSVDDYFDKNLDNIKKMRSIQAVYDDFKNSHQNISVSYAMVYTKYQQLFNTRKARNSASI